MAYCSIDKIRLVSKLESEDVHDEELRDIRDDVATPELNNDINVDINNELVSQFAGSKDNDVNGTNKTFWLKETHNNSRYIGDRNDDAVIDGNDIDAHYIDGDKRVDDLNVTVEDKEEGKIKVEETNGDPVPGTAALYLNYSVAPADVESDPQVATACAQLTAAYAYTRVEAGKLQDFSVGNITVSNRSEAMQEFQKHYRNTVQNLTQKELIQSGKNRQGISGVF